MADLLGSVFGGGQKTSQQTKVDPTTAAMNNLRLSQAEDVFRTAPLGEFGGARGDIYSPDAGTQELISSLANDITWQPSTQFDYGGYVNRGLNNRDLFDFGMERGGQNRDVALANTQGNFNAAMNNAAGGYSNALGMTGQNFNNAAIRAQQNYDAANNANAVNLFNAKMANEGTFNRGLDLGFGQANNFISKIATPQLLQMAALQGREGGGSVPTSIAKASAETGMQFLIPLLQQYMGSQAGLGETGAQLGGALGQSKLGTDAQLANANLSLQAGLGGESAALLGQLGGQNAAAQSGLLGQYNQQSGDFITNNLNSERQFMSTLPGAFSTGNMVPAQVAAMRAQAGTSLLPVMDFGRQLREQDLLRRQGIVGSAYSGLPYTPQTSVSGGQRQQPLFNFFGQG